MGSFQYKAVDPSGMPVAGVLTADTPEEARAQLRRMQLFPESVAPAGRVHARLWDALPGARLRHSMYVAVFTRQLAILIGTGVLMVEALRVLARQTEHRGLALAILEVGESVNAGRPVAEALAAYPQFFDRSYVGMVASGERSGSMDVVLARLADFLERRRLMQTRVSTALIYPTILVLMVAGLLFFLSGYVVPTIKPLLEERHHALPLATRMLFGLGSAVRGYAWMLLPLAAGAAVAVALLRRSAFWRPRMDAWSLRIPVIGDLWLKSLVARFAMSFATLLRTGVPAVEALDVLESVVPNAAFAEEVRRIKLDVVEGRDISGRMRSSRFFPPMVAYMVSVGERSGAMSDVLDHVAQAYDLEVDVASRRLAAALEPALVVIMAAVVGFIAASLMITVLELSRI